jgi:hypothetical protein
MSEDGKAELVARARRAAARLNRELKQNAPALSRVLNEYEAQPDPNITGPCQLQASPDCDGAGRQRLDPMAMLDFRDHIMACLACYEVRADMFVAEVHGR